MFRVRALGLAAFAACLALWTGAACSNVEHPPPLGSVVGVQPDGRDGGLIVDGSLGDGPPTCGGQVIPAIENPPTIYFVFDRSGSMQDPIDDSGLSKAVASSRAVGGVLRAIGHRIRYGAAIFPEDGRGCAGAHPILPISPGDPPNAPDPTASGPTLRTLLSRLANHAPSGSTPTAVALTELTPLITTQGERTFVVLATDGAPNCNAELTCPPSRCIPDLERQSFGSLTCGEGFSCCEGPGAGAACIDDEGTVTAVAALLEQGVPTYVIGMPGSETYAGVLNAMAVAGGTARNTGTAYYAVSDSSALTDAVFEIGTGIAISCDLVLREPPQGYDLVNVYFDGELVPYDGEHGWEWTGEASLSLRGDRCARLRSGSVLEVQIVYGCGTVVR